MIIAARGPSALPPLIFYISFHFLPPLLPSAILYPSLTIPSVSISCSLLHLPFLHLLFSHFSLPSPRSPIPLSGLSLYSLIAHNHSQSVSVTNRPIRVGSRPYGRQAASVMVSSICFLPSTHASVSHLCDLKGNVRHSRQHVTPAAPGFRVWVVQWTHGTEEWVNSCCCKDLKNHLLLCVDETKTTLVQRQLYTRKQFEFNYTVL